MAIAWIISGRVGNRGVCALNELDLTRTTQLNSERGVTVTSESTVSQRMAQTKGPKEPKGLSENRRDLVLWCGEGTVDRRKNLGVHFPREPCRFSARIDACRKSQILPYR